MNILRKCTLSHILLRILFPSVESFSRSARGRERPGRKKQPPIQLLSTLLSPFFSRIVLFSLSIFLSHRRCFLFPRLTTSLSLSNVRNPSSIFSFSVFQPNDGTSLYLCFSFTHPLTRGAPRRTGGRNFLSSSFLLCSAKLRWYYPTRKFRVIPRPEIYRKINYATSNSSSYRSMVRNRKPVTIMGP